MSFGRTRRIRDAAARTTCWLLAASFVGGLTGCREHPTSGNGEVWAEVNGQPLYRSEVEEYYEQQVAVLPEPLAPAEELARKLSILNELIQDEILWQEAARAGMRATDSEVENRIKELRASLTSEEFERQLSAQGTTLETLRGQLRRQISINKLLQASLDAGVTVTEKEITDYYEQYKNHFRIIETQFHVAHILVTPRQDPEVRNLRNDDAANDSQARSKTQLLRERLRAGEDFGDLARNYSEDPATALSGGDLGYFPESALESVHAAVRGVLRGMEPGQVAGPVRTPEGYELIKLLERESPGQRQLSDPQVKESIRSRLLRQKRQVLEMAYIEQARNRARVTNYLARHILESRRMAP